MNLKNETNIKNKLIQNLKHFENILDDKFENSQIILFYGFISIFLYIDITENPEVIYRIFEQILSRIKESIIYPSKNLINFNQIQYRKKIVKLFIKYRKYFSKFIIEKSKDIYTNKYINELIKLIIKEDNNSCLICETIFNDITNEFKNNIIKENIDDNYIKGSNKDLIKISHLLKIIHKISNTYKIYLKSNSFLEIIDPYIKNLAKNLGKKDSEKFGDNSQSKLCCKKIFKHWVELNISYVKNFRKKNSV